MIRYDVSMSMTEWSQRGIMLKEFSKERLRARHARMHVDFSSKKRPIEEIVKDHLCVVHELQKRDLKHIERNELDEKSGALCDMAQGDFVELPDEIVVVKDFVSQISADENGTNSDPIKILIRGDAVHGNFPLRPVDIAPIIRNEFLKSDRDSHFMFGLDKPSSAYVPMYDLVLRKQGPDMSDVHVPSVVMAFPPMGFAANPKKAEKSVVDYKEADSIKRCGACDFFIPDASDQQITLCSLVDGRIEPNSVCSLFRPETELEKAVRDKARRPTFTGVETISWASVSKTFKAYRDAYMRSTGSSKDAPSRVQDASISMKRWIAERTLLGDTRADNDRDLIFFPVVNPGTGKLNAGALRAVLGGRGTQANISAESLESAQSMARSLLNTRFEKSADEELLKFDVEIFAKSNEKQILYGIVVRPNEFDTQGDLAEREATERAMHGFMTSGAKVGLLHKSGRDGVIDATVVENWMQAGDKMFEGTLLKDGDWVMGVHVADKSVWQRTQTGELGAFSIQGVAIDWDYV